jgi:predicted secreted Zn-dependent protease
LQQRSAEPGLGELATAVIITAVFAIVLVGMLALDQRERAVAAWERDSAVAVLAADATATPPSATPTPSPGPDTPGRYTVQRGDSLFSVAAAIGVSPNELIFWNRDEYPSLQSTPALRPGWVLRTEGPPLPTRTPRPTPVPTPEPLLAAPSVPGLPTFTAAAFPASERVTVTWYAIGGATPSDIYDSIEANGPWSEWAGERATAHVLVQPSFDFAFESDRSGGCAVVPRADPAVSITYTVTLPAWVPPPGVSAATVEWWAEQIHRTVAHEAHHITLYEEHLAAMREIVATGTCSSVPDALQVVWDGAMQANCEYDLVEYGYAAGLTLESCMAQGG